MTPASVTQPVKSAYRAETLALVTLAAGEMTGALALPAPDPVFLAAGAAVVARAASRATAAADLSLALADPGTPALPLGLTSEPGVAVRARKGLATLLDELPGDPPDDGEAAAARREPITARAVRLARAESLDAGLKAYRDGMTRRGVRGWTRVTGPDPCPLCAGLAARNEVLPADHRMATHVGCSCVQRPTTLRPTRGRSRAA